MNYLNGRDQRAVVKDSVQVDVSNKLCPPGVCTGTDALQDLYQQSGQWDQAHPQQVY